MPACKVQCEERGENYCKSNNDGWTCTLPRFHRGEHIACAGGGHHDLDRWPNTHDYGRIIKLTIEVEKNDSLQ